MGSLELRCPRCGHIIVRFKEEELQVNRAKKRSYENLQRNPVLCQVCNQWVRKLHQERVEA